MAALFIVLMWLSLSASVIASAVTWFSPACRKNYLPGKMINSAMFVLTAVFASLAVYSAGRGSLYSILISAGLIFGLAGDFFLEWKSSKYFYVGVAFFAVNHFFYIYAFLTQFSTSLTPYYKYTLIGLAVTAVAAVIDIKLESIKFHGFENIMILYSAVLIASFAIAATRGAVCSFVDNSKIFGVLISAAGMFFVVSDTFLAAQLYGKSHFKKPEAGVLFFYFPAQTLFALSIFLFK